MSEISEAIEKLLEPLLKVQTIRCVVKSVDKSNNTCVASPMSGGADFLDVALNAGGKEKSSQFIVYPKVGSFVYLSIVNNNSNDTFIAQTSEFESVLIEVENSFKCTLNNDGSLLIDTDSLKFNDGTNGGLIKISELQKEIAKNTAIIKAVQSAFNAWVTVPNDGGAALKAASSSFVNLQSADLSNITNDKIQH